jgi:hypothetical protein
VWISQKMSILTMSTASDPFLLVSAPLRGATYLPILSRRLTSARIY